MPGPARRRRRADTRGIPRDVLTARAAVVEDRDEGPDAEVEGGPDQEERLIEVWRLPANERIVLGDPGMGPFVEIVQAEEHRQGERRHHGNRGEDRLADPSQHNPPSSLRRELDQHEKERAEGQAQKEQERHEPREEELLRIRGPQNRAGHRPQQGDAGADDRKAVPRVPRRDRDLLGPQRDAIAVVDHSGLQQLDASCAQRFQQLSGGRRLEPGIPRFDRDEEGVVGRPLEDRGAGRADGGASGAGSGRACRRPRRARRRGRPTSKVIGMKAGHEKKGLPLITRG